MRPPEPGLVSVITPCFNAADFIGETLDAVAAQTYRQIQHIVVDDGSTDSSLEILARRDGPVEVVRGGGNRGAAAARNRGVAEARGEYLMFLDADDLIEPETIEGLVAAARDHEHTIAVCRWNKLVLRRGKWRVRRAPVPFPPPPDALAGWLEGRWVPPCAVLWRRDSYTPTGGWTEDFNPNDDGDLMMRALLRGASLVVAQRGRSLYRMHDATRLSLSTSSFMSGRLEAQLAAYQRLEAELQEKDLFDRYAPSLGVAYRKLALRAINLGRNDMGRLCWDRADTLGGRKEVSRTLIGRILERLLGMEMKERVVEALASAGLMTGSRRRHQALRRRHRE